jgi:hypothetical protein
VIAITLDTAKNIAIVVAIIFIGGAIASLWLMKTIVQKLAVMAVLGLLAFAVWSQRTALQDCADKVQDNFELAGTDVLLTDSTCSFFGIEVTISDPRDG